MQTDLNIKQNDIIQDIMLDFTMSDFEFQCLSDLINKECGIKLPHTKKTMLSLRLKKRLEDLGIEKFFDYYKYISTFEGRSHELKNMMDAVTTNETNFFRNPQHFRILSERVLPEVIKLKHYSQDSINVWSAGCSTGEESYTIAMELEEFFSKNKKRDFSILSTDICAKALSKANRAIYSKTDIKPITAALKYKYFMRGKGSNAGFFRIVPELRRKVIFKWHNLMEDNFDITQPVDIIFCRNVVIYFNKATQIILFKKFYDKLVPGGFIFIGSSESFHGVNDQFKSIAATVYQKPL